MTTSTLSLTDFLLARIAEDVEAATMGEGWNTEALMDDVPVQFWDYGETHIGYRRFLAECEAKRRIVEFGSEASGDSRYESGRRFAIDETLCIMATVYADHPDYREEWRP